MAINSEYRHEQDDRPAKRDRYWSVMLVGDHGRIIPFRRFKGIAISVVGGLVLAVLVIIGLSIAYMLQAKTIDELKASVEESTRQITKLRDEKDLLLAKVVVTNKAPILEKKSETPTSDDTGEKEDKNITAKVAPKPEKQAATAAPKPSPEPKPAPKKKPTPPVQLGADIRRFNIKYQSPQNLLRCDFRIYNTSKPKRALAGRSVVVFKNMDEPPIKWLAVPRVQLTDGVPNGNRGKSFKINNYRTMTFKAYGMKPPVRFNAASIYVYTSEGKLLLNREIPINIDVPAPPPRKPAPAPAPPKPTTDRPADAPASQPQPAMTPPKPATTSSTPEEPSPVESEQGRPADQMEPKPAQPSPLTPTGTEQPSDVTPNQSADGNATESAPAQRPNPEGEPKSQGE
jgi:uncharacterized coiled-coil protein SlyX